MKVLAIMGPWGSETKETAQDNETRSWKTNYRG